MTTKDAIDALWDAVVSRIESNLSSQPGVQFFEWQVFYASRAKKAIVSLRRSVRFSDAAVKLLLGELTVEFGCMVQAGDKTRGKEDAEALAFWLADLFLDDPFLGGVARDMRIEEIEFDALPPENVQEGTSQHWVNVTVVWEKDFSRP
jgi:hypothetical protein